MYKFKNGMWVVLTAALLSLPAFGMPQNDVVGYWSLDLQPGFNLVNFPVLPDTPTPQAVFGDRVGAVQITCYDASIGSYRWSRFEPASGQWTGNLFILSRGTSYWVHLPDARRPVKLVVTGHPEVYTKLSLGNSPYGWSYLATTYGKNLPLSDLIPETSNDMLIGWNALSQQFEISKGRGQEWQGPIDRLQPDRGYILYRALPEANMPENAVALNFKVPQAQAPAVPAELGGCAEPPYPVILSNSKGEGVCLPDGRGCDEELTIEIARESVGQNGVIETTTLAQVPALRDADQAGKFSVALGAGSGATLGRIGDRIVLIAHTAQGAEARSTSFILEAGQRFLSDINFPDPLVAGVGNSLPTSFSISAPHPNPFNDRFVLDVRLPENAPVQVTIYDVTGRMVNQSTVPLGAGAHRMTISAQDLSAGIYMVNVAAGVHRQLFKVAHLK